MLLDAKWITGEVLNTYARCKLVTSMQEQLNLKPTHKLVKSYYETLGQYGQLDIDYEGAVRSAFQALLRGCGKQFEWTLVPEYVIHKPKAGIIQVDGALIDTFHLPRGYWEAKDEHDDLEKEIRAKFDRGYPKNNIIFQAPEKAILFQNGIRQGLNQDIRDGGNLVELLMKFFAYREPHLEEWDEAVEEFKVHIPQLAKAVEKKVEHQRQTNQGFVERFDAFYALCRQAINPNLSVEAVEKMLVQHLLTERIFRKVFDNPDFARRNVIAIEIERVIDSMTAREFSRDAFLKDLDHFYKTIELAADTAQDYSGKQKFINEVYQRFFQGYSPKEADTHGIVYTPQPIVDFMVRSVEDILKKEFARSLSDKGVHILDPFVGTGNFITRVMKEIKTTALPYKYENELHCNEVMLLPYYVASMNIEHEYMERTGEYQPFPGICMVDTFDMRAQGQMFTEANLDRIERQRQSPIFVVISNPPYNAWQLNENDNNKNRRYIEHNGVDLRVAETYSKESRATNKNALSDPYVKAFRWASDRIKEEGVVAFVSNSGFLDSLAADGMRRTLVKEFDEIFILDLGGNVRKNPKLSGTTHNVFGIQVGVCVSLLIRRKGLREKRECNIHFARTDEFWRKEQKYRFLDGASDRQGIAWARLVPDAQHNWLTEGLRDDFQSLTPLAGQLFRHSSNGVKTNRDAWLYNFAKVNLSENVRRSIEFYNAEVARWQRRKQKDQRVDDFVKYDEESISWSETLKKRLVSENELALNEARIRLAIYRPFCKKWLYFDRQFVERVYGVPSIFPEVAEGHRNTVLWVKVGGAWPTFAVAVDVTPDLLPEGGSHCFPFYTYDEDGSNRRENITDCALNEFRTHYSDPNITKWDIFHYVYAMLHHPQYRQRYAANLKRELPRIPFITAGPSTPPEAGSAQDDAATFWQLVEAGRRLAELHVNYEQQPEYPLEQVEKGQLNLRVEKMRLSKDKTTLIYNEFLTLKGIPPETYDYRLGNRSALEWVIDQYRVSTDKRSGITNDPNRADDPEYILRLIGQVITVSLETMKIVEALPPLASQMEKRGSQDARD